MRRRLDDKMCVAARFLPMKSGKRHKRDFGGCLMTAWLGDWAFGASSVGKDYAAG
jgi:hypothetical protein